MKQYYRIVYRDSLKRVISLTFKSVEPYYKLIKSFKVNGIEFTTEVVTVRVQTLNSLCA